MVAAEAVCMTDARMQPRVATTIVYRMVVDVAVVSRAVKTLAVLGLSVANMVAVPNVNILNA